MGAVKVTYCGLWLSTRAIGRKPVAINLRTPLNFLDFVQSSTSLVIFTFSFPASLTKSLLLGDLLWLFGSIQVLWRKP